MASLLFIFLKNGTVCIYHPVSFICSLPIRARYDNALRIHHITIVYSYVNCPAILTEATKAEMSEFDTYRSKRQRQRNLQF